VVFAIVCNFYFLHTKRFSLFVFLEKMQNEKIAKSKNRSVYSAYSANRAYSAYSAYSAVLHTPPYCP
jgi:hypothetical protein